MGGAGITKAALPIYRMLGWRLGTVRQLYMVNQAMNPSQFRLLGNFDGKFAHVGGGRIPGSG